MYEGKDSKRDDIDEVLGRPVSATEYPADPKLKNMGFLIALDNWYTSVILFITLITWGFRALGTVKANVRGIPKGDFLFKKSGAGKKTRGKMSTTTTPLSIASVTSASVHVTTWMDSKPVIIVSTFPTMN